MARGPGPYLPHLLCKYGMTPLPAWPPTASNPRSDRRIAPSRLGSRIAVDYVQIIGFL